MLLISLPLSRILYRLPLAVYIFMLQRYVLPPRVERENRNRCPTRRDGPLPPTLSPAFKFSVAHSELHSVLEPALLPVRRPGSDVPAPC